MGTFYNKGLVDTIRSVLLSMIIKKTETLKLFTINIKTEFFHKLLKCQARKIMQGDLFD
jgi:hypothetical protein